MRRKVTGEYETLASTRIEIRRKNGSVHAYFAIDPKLIESSTLDLVLDAPELPGENYHEVKLSQAMVEDVAPAVAAPAQKPAAPAKDEPGKADASNKPVGRLAEEKKPLSAETILEKKVEGKATVEFLVREVHTLNIDALFVPDVSHAQIIKAKVSKDGHEFWVIVSREIATRLLRLGVVDPAEHFRGKLIRVSGTVERVAPPSLPSPAVYKLHVTSLDQLESIRKP
jgi:hypothetical protein